MVGIAKSQALKRQTFRKEVDNLKAHAVELYKAEEERILALGQKKWSLRQICKDTSDAHFAETGRRIPLAHNTLARHAKGGITLTQSNREKSWLTVAEEENIINFTIEVAQRGFPLSPQCHGSAGTPLGTHANGEDSGLEESSPDNTHVIWDHVTTRG
jgi:hypothetical protein